MSNMVDKITTQLLSIELKQWEIEVALKAIKKDMESKLAKELAHVLEENRQLKDERRELKRTLEELSEENRKLSLYEDYDPNEDYDLNNEKEAYERGEAYREPYQERE